MAAKGQAFQYGYSKKGVWQRAWQLKAKYKISVNEYNKRLREQDGCCAICGDAATEGSKRLSVDHNHETGEIRGLLCIRCNSMLGYARDYPWILRKAANYLEGRAVFGEGSEENVKLETFVPFEDVEDKAISNALYDQITASLTDDEYDILMAEYGDDPELAGQLGVSENTIRMRRHRLKEMLKKKFGCSI